MSNTFRIPHPQLVARITAALAEAGMTAPARDIEAEVMVEADLFGVPSHGVRMLPGLLDAFRGGQIPPVPAVRIVADRGASCMLDGGRGPGRHLSVRAMSEAVKRARQFGVGACAAIRVSHWGRAHAYAFRAAQAGCIGICTTNAVPSLVAWGSAKPLLGNNPLAIGIPRAGGDPVAMDMAMTQAAVGKVATYKREGRKVPDNWGLDAAGQPTDDPAAIMASRRFLPFGDHKGVGMALMMELLTGALTGGLLAHEMVATGAFGLDQDGSKLFIALDADAFGGFEAFARRTEDLLAYLKSAQPGLDVVFPGERGLSARDRNLRDGIPIHDEIVAQLKQAGVDLTQG